MNQINRAKNISAGTGLVSGVKKGDLKTKTGLVKSGDRVEISSKKQGEIAPSGDLKTKFRDFSRKSLLDKSGEIKTSDTGRFFKKQDSKSPPCMGKLYEELFDNSKNAGKADVQETSPNSRTDEIDLTGPVKIRGVETSFKDYCEAVESSQDAAVEALKSPRVRWHDLDRLRKKVDEDGRYIPFYGDTLVVRSSEEDVERASALQKKIIEAVPGIFAEPLHPSTFHITIHDLDNGNDRGKLEPKMDENREKVKREFKKLSEYFKKHPDQAIVYLKPSIVCPDATVSIKFLPASEKDYRTVMNLRDRFDKIVNLDNRLEMHVSLCYFKPKNFSGRQREKLYSVLTGVNKNLDFPVKMDLRNLAYQRFFSMNDYRDQFTMSDVR